MLVVSKPAEPGEGVPPTRVLTLLDLPNEMLYHILEFCGIAELKKLLALKNRLLLTAIRKCKTKNFKYWTFRMISLERFRKFMNDVSIIKGFESGAFIGRSETADEIVEALTNEREELESFKCHSSWCTDRALQLLLTHPSRRMKVVRLSCSSVTGEGLREISSCCNAAGGITELDLSHCISLTDDGVIAILNLVGRKLNILNLKGTKVSFSNLGSLTNTFPVLEEVNLAWCWNITDSSIMEFIGKTMGKLKILNLAHTGVSLSETGSLTSCPIALEEVNLTGCWNLTDARIMEFINTIGETVKILSLVHTAVSFISVESLTTTLPELRTLDLRGCRRLITDGLIAFLGKTSGQLELKIDQ